MRLYVLFGRDLHFDGFLAEFFMHRGQRVLTRRQVLDLKIPVIVSDGEVWMSHYVDIGTHPGMLVALQRPASSPD